MSYINEHTLEIAIMDLFKNEDYIYTSGEEEHKELRIFCFAITCVHIFKVVVPSKG